MYVIARYNEDISWADDLNKFIVQKDVHLPNIGRESSSYLWYIINNYYSLNGKYQFRQGASYCHLRIDYSNLKESDHCILKCSDHNGLPDHPNLKIKEFADRIELNIPEILSFIAGAQFDVTTAQIYCRSLEWYKRVYEECMQGPDIILAPYILERLWQYIFTPF